MNVAEYAAFLVARQVVASTMQKNLAVLRKLLSWRMTLVDARELAARRLHAVGNWLDVLMKQGPNAALPNQGHMQRTKLPHARDVLKWQLKVEEATDSLLAKDIALNGKIVRHSTACASQDAAFLALAFGYLPTPRLMCIRTCLHPDRVIDWGGCLDTDCR